MDCAPCSIRCQRFGKHRNGLSRFRCPKCHKTYTEVHEAHVAGMLVPVSKAKLALQLLLECNSIRATERISGLHRDTIMRLLVIAGQKAEAILGRTIHNIPVRDVELDEIWGFVGKKQKSIRPGDDPNFGDAYTFVAIERKTKLVLNFALGKRDQATTNAFIEGLRLATAPQPFQVTADGFPAYPFAIESTLSDRVDFCQLIKVYRATPEGERRYSPAEVVSTEAIPRIGNPDPRRVCTSIVERGNLTMSMQIKRLARLTLCYSKKWDNLWAALCLHFWFYNFARIHSSLRVTPAMAANITDRVWEISELLA